MAEEVANLERLLDLFEENLDSPSALIEITNAEWSPLEVISNEDHLDRFPIDLHPSHDSAHALWVIFFTPGNF